MAKRATLAILRETGDTRILMRVGFEDTKHPDPSSISRVNAPRSEEIS
jgi:hypothetical protein